jgi:hypothetical protein
MSSISGRVPLLSKSDNKQIVIHFEIRPLYVDEKNLKPNTKSVDEYSIQIVVINNVSTSENAIAITEKLKYGGIRLFTEFSTKEKM